MAAFHTDMYNFKSIVFWAFLTFALHGLDTSAQKRNKTSTKLNILQNTTDNTSYNAPLVIENFKDNRFGWTLFKDSIAEAKFQDNALILHNYNRSSLASATRSIAISPYNNFNIAVMLNVEAISEDSKFGLLWNGRDNNNYNVCWLQFGKRAEVHTVHNAASQIIAISKDTLPISLSEKLLKVELNKRSNILTFSVNNTIYCRFDMPSFNGLLLGVIAKGRIMVKLDSLAIFQHQPPIILADKSSQTIIKEQLDSVINSPYAEKLPVISADGKVLWFTRANHPQNIGVDRSEDIWYSSLDSSGKWCKPINPGPPLNNEYSNSVVSVTPDNNTLLLYGTYEYKDKEQIKIANDKKNEGNSYIRRPTLYSGFFISHRTIDNWSIPKQVVIHNFYTLGDKISACLSSDQKVMIISLEREDSFGLNDLYACFALPDSTWSEPHNLGANVNSFDDDSNPFLAADGKTFYFTTAGRTGFGDKDIFVARRLDSAWLNWSEPQNLGENVNTPLTEASYTTTASGSYSYYVSKDTISGSLDIFRLKLPDSARPRPLALIKGRTINSKSGSPITADIYYERLSDGKEIGHAQSNPNNGSYTIALPAGELYGFRAEAEGYTGINDFLDLSKLHQYIEIERDLTLVPIEKGAVIRLNNIFFDFGKSDLKSSSFAELNRVVQFLQTHPDISIEIAGHTDNIGAAERKMEVSSNRASAVAEFLENSGINRDRIIIRGYGDTMPIASNATEAGRQKNRRVEFIIR